MTVAKRKIIVGVDGSENSAASLQWAAALAQESGGTVSAVMAWNYPTPLLMPVVGAPLLPPDFVQEKTQTMLMQVVDSVDASDVVIEDSIVMGAARQVLTETAKKHDLLVVGRSGHSRMKQIFLGSTVSYCVRNAECPVVVVRGATAPEQGITVAVDGSPSSIEALVWAMELGDHHELVAVYSHDEWELDDLPFDDDVRRELDEKADTMLAAAVATAVERTGADEARVTRQVRQGDPRTTLVDQADPSRFLVLGAQGHSGIARWMLGSLADYAVQHAPGTVAIWR